MQEPPTHDIRAGAQHFATLDDYNADNPAVPLQNFNGWCQRFATAAITGLRRIRVVGYSWNQFVGTLALVIRQPSFH